MIEITRKNYICEHCRKNYVRKHACEWHEKHCSQNPLNQHVCWGCDFLKRWREHGEIEYYCVQKDIQLHSYVAERRRLSCVVGTERMPNKCSQFRYKCTVSTGIIDFGELGE